MKKLNLFIFACLFSSSLVVFGQESVADKKARAESLAVEAINLVKNDTIESFKSSIPKLEEAGKLFKEIDNKGMEAYCWFILGKVYIELGEKRRASSYLENSLPLFIEVGDNDGQVAALTLAAVVYDELGETQKAINYFEKILGINGISKISESSALLRIGSFYFSLEQYERAIIYFNRALSIFKELNNQRAQLAIQKSIGEAYWALGENEKALKYLNDILLINRAATDKIGEGAVLNNLGLLYSSLGEEETALKYLNDALLITRETKNRKGEAYILSNIGEVYSYLGNNQEALDYCNKALVILKDIGDKAGEGAALSNIATTYSLLGEKKKALEYFHQALPVRQSVGDKVGEASTLSGLGATYGDLGENRKAIDYLLKALPIAKVIKDKGVEARALANLFGVLTTENPRLATLLGKKSINQHQLLRQAIRGLDTEIQKSYLRRVQVPYQALIQILLSQNRTAEAFQVISAARNQQTLDVVAAELERQSKPLRFTPREEKFSRLYEETADKIGNIGGLIEEFKREFGSSPSNPQQTHKLEQLEVQLKAASEEFLAVIRQAETEFARSPDKDDAAPEIKDLSEMQTALRQLNAQTGEKIATVYTVIGKERFTELIVAHDKVSSVFTTIKGKDLDEKAREFADIIKITDSQNKPRIDATEQAKELYNIIFKPVEAELPKSTTTIMWALDHNLRYIPINALHDGKDYLIRRKLNNVVFTRSESERFLRPLNPQWRATGLANSKAKKNVKNLDISHDFAELVAVESEMQGIFKKEGSTEGIIDGDVLENQDFTRASMLAALKKKNPVVHISSHFSIKSGDIARSFLLLGDGTVFPLSDMSKESRLFEGVDLLTLSACNTAMDEPNSEGREVDGFAELAQRLGAASVIATLWAVNECSTAEFMKLFYQNKVNGKMTKAEALSQAQLALLDGKVKITGENCKANKAGDNTVLIEPKSKKTYKAYKYNSSKPFEHPYYWSPFVLYGNWK